MIKNIIYNKVVKNLQKLTFLCNVERLKTKSKSPVYLADALKLKPKPNTLLTNRDNGETNKDKIKVSTGLE